MPRVLVFALSVAAMSGASVVGEEVPLRVAVFQVDATPPLGTPLCEGGCEPAKEIVDRLSARGMAILTEDKPIVLCVLDWVGIGNGGYDAWREALAKAAGTTPDRVSVHTVHQHDTPLCDFTGEEILKAQGLSGTAFDPAFARETISQAAEALRKSMQEPRPVTQLGMGRAKVEKVASNRRILGPDGKVKYVRYSSCQEAEVRAAPEGVIDPYVRLLSFWDADKPVASLTYYATHPQSYYCKGGVSADFVGMARSMREAALPGVFHMHFAGAAGNVAAGKYNDGSPENRPVLARRLAEGMKAAWEATTKVPIRAGDVRWKVVPVALPLRDIMDEDTLAARLADQNARLTARIVAAEDLAWTRRCKAGYKVELSCLRLGPAYVVHMPGELFVEYQLAAQAMQPEAMVCMAAYGDYGPGYICTEIAYSQGGYEAGTVSRVGPKVEGVLMGALRELVK